MLRYMHVFPEELPEAPLRCTRLASGPRWSDDADHAKASRSIPVAVISQLLALVALEIRTDSASLDPSARRSGCESCTQSCDETLLQMRRSARSRRSTG